MEDPRSPAVREVEGVGIRPYREGDVEALFEAGKQSIAEMYPWLPWCHPDYSLEDAQEWVSTRAQAWEKAEAYSFAVYDVKSERMLGGCGLGPLVMAHRYANLGYWVRTGETGRGVATRAVRLTAAFGLAELELQRIEIVVSTANVASQKVAEKAGAIREGVQRKRLLIHGEVQDAVMYSLVPGDL